MLRRLVDEEVVEVQEEDRARLYNIRHSVGNPSHWKEVLRVQEWKLVEGVCWHWLPWVMPAGSTAISDYVTYHISTSPKTGLPVASHLQIKPQYIQDKIWSWLPTSATGTDRPDRLLEIAAAQVI